MEEKSFDPLEEIEIWEAWEHDLGTEIPKEMWEDSAKQKSSICIGHGLVLFEVFIDYIIPMIGYSKYIHLLLLHVPDVITRHGWVTCFGPVCLDDFQFIAGYVQNQSNSLRKEKGKSFQQSHNPEVNP